MEMLIGLAIGTVFGAACAVNFMNVLVIEDLRAEIIVLRARLRIM